LRLSILPLLLTLAPLFAGAQTKPEVASPTFPSAVERVRVDVVVTDKGGRPVSGLTQGDFALSEGGVPHPITSFEAVSVAEAPEDAGQWMNAFLSGAAAANGELDLDDEQLYQADKADDTENSEDLR